MDNIFYMYSNMDGSSQILIFLIILVGLMLVSILIINCITKKRNEKYNNKFHRVDKYSNYSKEKKVKRDIMNVEKPIVKEVKEVKPIQTIEIKKEPIIAPKEELEEVLDESEVIEIISENNTVEKISNLIEDDINNPKLIDLTKFEEDEERNAIISYDELVKKAGAKKIIYKTEKQETPKEKIVVKEEVKPVHEEIKGKFRASQVISPIYGIQKEKKEKDEIEEFIDVENIPINNVKKYEDEELQKDITFLTNLKTFRSNLD